MTLYTLNFGKSKKRMYPIMIDSFKKCENYMNARSHCKGFHSIVPAVDGTVWRQKSATIGGNRCESVQRVGHGPSGYINKRGFQQHT